MEQGLSKNQLIAEISRSSHGRLEEYVPVVGRAVREEAEFSAHFIAWNHAKGQIRDSKVALPVLSLAEPVFHDDFVSNSLACLAKLDVRDLVRAYRFAKGRLNHGRQEKFKSTIRRYIRRLEENWAEWERVAMQHRDNFKRLYALVRIRPNAMADQILFKEEYPRGTVFHDIRSLKNMSPMEAAGTIMERKIPFLVASGAMGAKLREPDVVLALIDRMTASELINSSAMLAKLGVMNTPALKAAYDQALTKAEKSKKNLLKASKAAEAVSDTKVKAKLRAAQERTMKAAAVEGNWLVLGDKSSSMVSAIEVSRHVAATLAKMVKGQVHLVFFDSQPRYIDATGKTYEELLDETKYIEANGWTAIGCGLLAISERNIEVDGIAIVSDGQETQPPAFADVYPAYSEAIGKQVPVYLYRCYTQWGGVDIARMMSAKGLDLQEFDLRQKEVDYYSIPNMVQTMRTQRYSLIDEIMEFPLFDLDKVLPPTRREAMAV